MMKDIAQKMTDAENIITRGNKSFQVVPVVNPVDGTLSRLLTNIVDELYNNNKYGSKDLVSSFDVPKLLHNGQKCNGEVLDPTWSPRRLAHVVTEYIAATGRAPHGVKVWDDGAEFGNIGRCFHVYLMGTNRLFSIIRQQYDFFVNISHYTYYNRDYKPEATAWRHVVTYEPLPMPLSNVTKMLMDREEGYSFPTQRKWAWRVNGELMPSMGLRLAADSPLLHSKFWRDEASRR